MDNLTLLYVIILLSLLSTLALAVNWQSNRYIPGLRYFPIGFGLVALGLILSLATPIHGLVGTELVTALLFGLIICGFLPVVIGLATMWNQQNSIVVPIYALVTVAAVVGLTYFSFVSPSVFILSKITPSAHLCFSLCGITLLYNGQKSEREMRTLATGQTLNGVNFCLILFSLYAALNLSQLLISEAQFQQFSEVMLSSRLLGLMILLILFPFAIVIMTTEELTLELMENTIFDPVTRLISFRTFLEVGEKVVDIARRNHMPVSLLTIELEQIDELTRSSGEMAANSLLKQFADIAMHNRRNEDLLTRYGNKEFRMLLPGVSAENAQIVVSKITQGLAKKPLRISTSDSPVSVTIVDVTACEDELNLQKMLQQGDMALHRSKAIKPDPALDQLASAAQ